MFYCLGKQKHKSKQDSSFVKCNIEPDYQMRSHYTLWNVMDGNHTRKL